MKQFLLVLALASVVLQAQKFDPVQWALRTPTSVAPGQQTVVELTATVQPVYHLYSLTTPAGGAIPTTVKFGENVSIVFGVNYFSLLFEGIVMSCLGGNRLQSILTAFVPE